MSDSVVNDETTFDPADAPTVATGGPGRMVVEPGAPEPEKSKRRGWLVLLKPVGGLSAFFIILLCAIISGFADPSFGPGGIQKSVRLVASLLTGFYMVNYGGLLVKWIIGRRKRSGHMPRVTSRWAFLLLALFMAGYARLTGIDPVLVFASVVAIDFGLRAGSVRSVIATIGGALNTAVIGVLAYLGYSILVAHPVQAFIPWNEIATGERYRLTELLAYANIAVGELFAIVAVIALTTLVIGLLPFVAFEGINLWRASRVGWVAVYAVSVALFMTVVIPVGHEGEWTGPARWWAALYVAYAIGGLIVTIFLRPRPASSAGESATRTKLGDA